MDQITAGCRADKGQGAEEAMGSAEGFKRNSSLEELTSSFLGDPALSGLSLSSRNFDHGLTLKLARLVDPIIIRFTFFGHQKCR